MFGAGYYSGTVNCRQPWDSESAVNTDDEYIKIGKLLDDWQNQAERQVEVNQRLVADLEQVEVVAESRDRCVRVVVDSNGALSDLSLSDDMYEYSPDELAETILNLFVQARADVANQIHELTSAAWGADSPDVKATLRSYRPPRRR